MPDRQELFQQICVLGIYGFSDSGKTTLLECLIRDLKREGYRVAAIKVSGHELKVDQPGKDTWRYAQAGAHPIVLSARDETEFFIDGVLDMAAILKVLCVLQQPDIVLVEGAHEEAIRKIRIGDIDLRRIPSGNTMKIMSICWKLSTGK
jgi:molybdopterin-guanine dinucleotide biosynthesis protein MobB